MRGYQGAEYLLACSPEGLGSKTNWVPDFVGAEPLQRRRMCHTGDSLTTVVGGVLKEKGIHPKRAL